MKSPKPYSAGRIVLYVPVDPKIEGGQHCNHTEILPAIIVNAWEILPEYQEEGKVNLKVFTDGYQESWRTSVPYSEEKEPGTWHWPEMK